MKNYQEITHHLLSFLNPWQIDPEYRLLPFAGELFVTLQVAVAVDINTIAWLTAQLE